MPKDTLLNGHFAERTLCRKDTLSKGLSPNGDFDERTFRREDILPKGQLAENREIFRVLSTKCPFSKMSFGKMSDTKRDIISPYDQNKIIRLGEMFSR